MWTWLLWELPTLDDIGVVV
jgi:hypothetical protein